MHGDLRREGIAPNFATDQYAHDSPFRPTVTGWKPIPLHPPSGEGSYIFCGTKIVGFRSIGGKRRFPIVVVGRF